MEFISILLLISFFWNTMHQIFIPAVTVRSWFKKDYFTIATFKLKVIVIHLRITVMAFFYAIFMQHMPCFCKQKKAWIWLVFFLLYFIQAVLHSGKKHVICKICFWFFFHFKTEFICCKIDLKHPLAAE